MAWGHIYILSNPAFEGLLKIGQTYNDVNERADQLFTTGVPSKFKVEFQVYLPLPETVEQIVHQALSEYRVDRNREFFRCSRSYAVKKILETARRFLLSQVSRHTSHGRWWARIYERKPRAIIKHRTAKNGKGYWNFKIAGSYLGECRGGMRHGRGTLWTHNGFTFSGTFRAIADENLRGSDPAKMEL
jgi:hypothetical protein